MAVNLISRTKIYLKKQGFLKVFFAVFVAAYAVIILINPHLGPTDDFMLLRTLQSGHPVFAFSPDFPYGDLAKYGRFTLLWPMDYNFFGLFMKSPSAFWYFLVHAFQYVLIMVILVRILSRATSNRFLIYLTPVLLSLTPAMTIPFFRTHLIERNVIFFYLAFLFFYLLHLEKPKSRYIFWGILSVNLAIYYKESAFIALGAFAFFHLFLTWKNSKRGVKIFDGLILVSCFLYLLLYYLIIYRHLTPGSHLYGYNPFNYFLVLAKNILNYSFFTDPIIIFLLLPFTAWRLYKFIRRKIELHPIYDSMLLAGSAYSAGYLVLNSYGPNYMLPVYIFALPPLIYFFSQRQKTNLALKAALVICGLALLFNVFPAGLYFMTYYKYLSPNFNQMLDFLIKDINSNHQNQKMNIFLDGTDLAGGRTGPYFILAEFLHYRKLPIERYDLKSNVFTPNPTQVTSYIKFPFTVFESDTPSEIKSGDYLVVTPEETEKNVTSAYIQSLNKDYELLFRTYSPLAFPNINLKTLAKYLLSQTLSENQKQKGLMTNENLTHSPDYYIFIKK